MFATRLLSGFLLSGLLAFPPSDLTSQEARSYVDPRVPGAPDVAPYSGAVWVGNTLYLAGTLAIGAGDDAPATASQEARMVLDAVKSTLERAGLTMDDLVSVQVFATDLGDYADFNREYRTYFTREFPVRAFIGVRTLLFGARFEVQGLAVKR